MTDPVNGISGTQGPSAGGSYSGGTPSDHHKKRAAAGPQNDLIEISQKARNQSKVKAKKGLLEYLKDLLGL